MGCQFIRNRNNSEIIFHSLRFGSITQASTVRLGLDEKGNDVNVPMNSLLPMVNPDDLCKYFFFFIISLLMEWF